MIKTLLASYQKAIEKAIFHSIPLFGPKTPLRDAIEYALNNGGKRFRPAIVYLIGSALGKEERSLDDGALAIEFFHTASLIADDLPCMDDEAQRRECPALHIAFGEATAILATYALIATGYDKIRIAAENTGKQEICPIAIEIASRNTGIFGATGGQYEDLFLDRHTAETLLDLMDKKTGTLFEISFAYGWLFGGGEVSLLPEVSRAARSFGRAFQIYDDLQDLVQDQEGPNYAKIVGISRAKQRISEELSQYFHSLTCLNLATPELLALGHSLEV